MTVKEFNHELLWDIILGSVPRYKILADYEVDQDKKFVYQELIFKDTESGEIWKWHYETPVEGGELQSDDPNIDFHCTLVTPVRKMILEWQAV